MVLIGPRNLIMDGYVKYGLVQDAGQLVDEMSEMMVVDWNLMISGYWNWGNEVEARQMFDIIPERNAVLWNAMLSGYAQNGFAEEAVELFNETMNASVQTDKTFWAAVISSCSSHGDPCLAEGLIIRAYE
ncbi:hypothetical protein LguiA_008141 [Lonicera macranthoides]